MEYISKAQCLQERTLIPKVSLDYLFIDDIQNKKNIYVDTVMIRMSYMEEQDQKMVLKFVEDFSEYIAEREKDKK